MEEHIDWGGRYYKGEKASLKQEVIDDLVSDHEISPEELQAYLKVGRAIERRYRKLLKASGPSAISLRMDLFSRWRQIREVEIDKSGQDAVVNLFTEDEIMGGLTVYNAMSHWLKDSLGNHPERTIQALAYLPLHFPKPVGRGTRKIIMDAQERARMALEMREEI